MLTYNTQQKKLKLPEYGRNIQQMVDHCLTIADRDERTRCAHTIVATMDNLLPELHDSEDYRHKLWDHLAIMSDFKLDIDWPYEVIKSEALATEPEKIPYAYRNIRYRHYGKGVEAMIEKAIAMEPGEERTELCRIIANHMKKLQLAVNTEGVDDRKIFKDLAEMSRGEIIIRPDEMRLHEFKMTAAPATGKKKKKK